MGEQNTGKPRMPELSVKVQYHLAGFDIGTGLMHQHVDALIQTLVEENQQLKEQIKQLQQQLQQIQQAQASVYKQNPGQSYQQNCGKN